MHLRPRCEPAVPSVPAVSMTARSASGNDDARMGPDAGLIDLLDMLRHAEPPQAEGEQVVSRRGAVLPPGQPAVGKTVDAKTLRDLRHEEGEAAVHVQSAANRARGACDMEPERLAQLATLTFQLEQKRGRFDAPLKI